MSKKAFYPMKDKIFTDFAAKVASNYTSERMASSDRLVDDGIFKTNQGDTLNGSIVMEEPSYRMESAEKVQRPGIIKGRSQRLRNKQKNHYGKNGKVRYLWNMEKENENGLSSANHYSETHQDLAVPRETKKRASSDYQQINDHRGPVQKPKRTRFPTSPSPMQFC